MTSSLKGAILKTLSYADIFDFPLKKQELYRFLITDKKINRKLFDKAFREIKKERRWIEAERGFYFASAKKRAERVYFLKGREKIVRLRKDKKRWSRKKLKIAKRTAQFLKIIPFVKMVAVTGALAMENSKKEDDIDFLIVAQKGRIWITRFLTTILVEIFAKRRRPGDKKIADKICLNMFLDEEHLTVPVQEQDLFSAHEVVQLKPLWDKERTYEKFLAANQWVKKFLANTKLQIKIEAIFSKSLDFSPARNYKNFFILICHLAFYILNFAFVEKILKQLQLIYMRRRRTTEVISEIVIRFHPKDARKRILAEYQKRLKRLGINPIVN